MAIPFFSIPAILMGLTKKHSIHKRASPFKSTTVNLCFVAQEWLTLIRNQSQSLNICRRTTYPMDQVPSDAVHKPSGLKGWTGGKHLSPAAEPSATCTDELTSPYYSSTTANTHQVGPAGRQPPAAGVLEEEAARPERQRLDVAGIDAEGGGELVLEDADGVPDGAAVLAGRGQDARRVAAAERAWRRGEPRGGRTCDRGPHCTPQTFCAGPQGPYLVHGARSRGATGAHE